MPYNMKADRSLPYDFYATVERLTPTESGARYSVFLVRWPCHLAHIRREDTMRDGFPNATHILSGQLTVQGRVQSGDRITSLRTKKGTNYVRDGKAWSVVGRRHFDGMADQNEQTVYVQEEL